jgi:enoyl-CoA hydratase/carnithine racemase
MGILTERKDHIVQITINRPEVLNAMDPETYEEIGKALVMIENDPEVRVGIITGAGDRAFSAGADIKRMHGDREREMAWAPWRPDRFDFGLATSKPMIAAINGYALAGGLELALLCDIRIAASHAQFGTPEVKWNLLHGYGALRLPQIIPLSYAMEMLLTGEFIDAQTALRLGLVSRVVPAEELLPTAYAIAEKICNNGPLAVQMTKELVLRGLSSSLEDALRLYKAYYQIIGYTDDLREGTAAFAEKRAPVFRGK